MQQGIRNSLLPVIQSSQTKAQQQIQRESRMKRRENMKSCRKTIGIAAAILSIAVICVTFFQVTSAKASDKLVIRLAHNQAAGSEIAAVSYTHLDVYKRQCITSPFTPWEQGSSCMRSP